MLAHARHKAGLVHSKGAHIVRHDVIKLLRLFSEGEVFVGSSLTHCGRSDHFAVLLFIWMRIGLVPANKIGFHINQWKSSEYQTFASSYINNAISVE